MPTFRHRTTIPASAERVFRWHARPGAFERLIPPWERVDVVERTGGLRPGSRVRLRVRRGPVTVGWTLEHVEVDEGRGFRDEQVSGPFGSWSHAHRFRPSDGDGCVVEDEVRWEPPGGALASASTRPLVERELERVFRFRHRRLAHDLDRVGREAETPWTVAISGASGLVGSALSHFLEAAGHRVLPLVRSREAAEAGDEVYWNVERSEIDAAGLEGVDAVVHLAGEPIFGWRWTESKKRRILESRRRGTRLLSTTLAALDRPPAVLVSASGVHFYGDRGREVLTEESPSGQGFLARVCREWERATAPAERAGIRVVTLRSGVVLTPAGGALEQMLRPFRAGVGGRIGSGDQYMSWIDADDQVALVHHALRRSSLRGPMNAVAPQPLPNAAFTDVLGRVLGRPTMVPVPAFAVKAALGEMGRELLLQSTRAHPEAALRSGFEFTRPDVEASLRHQLGRSEGGGGLRTVADDDGEGRGG